MNTADFYDAQCDNEVVNAKRQAYLDHIYETERAKYSSPQVQTRVVERVVEKPVPTQTNNPEVLTRLDRLETRVDALSRLLTNLKSPEPKKGDLFVFAPNSTEIYANSAIVLSDEQFRELISTLKEI